MNASLSLTSMIDFLVVCVVFLLITFNASASTTSSHIHTPPAVNFSDLIDAPIVTVDNGRVLLDGAAAGSVRAVEESHRVQAIPELVEGLKRKRELAKSLRADRALPEAVLVHVDEDTSALVIKSLFVSMTSAGFPQISFVVQKAR